MGQMKKLLGQILVFTCLLTGYCPAVLGNAHVKMGGQMDHFDHDSHLAQKSTDQMDCCEEGMPDFDEGVFKLADEIEVAYSVLAFIEEPDLKIEANSPDWDSFANNSDPPHLNLTGTSISLE